MPAKAIKHDPDAETIAKYRALEQRYVAGLRHVRVVIRRAPSSAAPGTRREHGGDDAEVF